MFPSHNSSNSFFIQEITITGPKVEGTYINKEKRALLRVKPNSWVMEKFTFFFKQQMSLLLILCWGVGIELLSLYSLTPSPELPKKYRMQNGMGYSLYILLKRSQNEMDIYIA
jgi:hypothetical protein